MGAVKYLIGEGGDGENSTTSLKSVGWFRDGLEPVSLYIAW